MGTKRGQRGQKPLHLYRYDKNLPTHLTTSTAILRPKNHLQASTAILRRPPSSSLVNPLSRPMALAVARQKHQPILSGRVKARNRLNRVIKKAFPHFLVTRWVSEDRPERQIHCRRITLACFNCSPAANWRNFIRTPRSEAKKSSTRT
jgi:hypothetical protein